ncbi:hypothetical protein ABPG72_012695 [Tetrahymena utriculariae]
MKKAWQILLCILLVCQVSQGFEFLDYTEEHNFHCYTDPTDQERSLYYQQVILHEIDRYLFIAFCPLTIMATSFIIYTFIKYPGTRNSPGDLLLGTSICELLLNFHWLMASIYNIRNDGENPDPDRLFCRLNSILSIPSGILDFAYNFILNIYISLTLKNSLKGYSPKTRYWHILMVFSAAIIIVIFETIPNYAGISVFGTCSYTSNKLVFVSGPLIGIFYALLGYYMFRQFHKTIPDTRQKFANKRQEFLIYYAYVKVTSCIYLLLGITNLMIGLNCYFLHNPGLNIFLTITNFLKLLSPVILSLLRYRDPILKQRVFLELKKCKRRFNKKQNFSSVKKQLVEPINNDVSYDQLNNQGIQITSQAEVRNEQSRSFIQEDQFKDMRQFLRQLHLTSMVSGILQEFSEDREKESIEQLTKDDFIEKDADIIINNDQNNQDLDEQYEKLSIKMTVYAKKVFQLLRQKYSNGLNLVDSLQLDANNHLIQKASGEGKGGASGEFFFFTHDNNLLLKTINSNELEILLEKLDKFVTHYEQKEDSLITKIYGIFTFQQQASYDRPNHIIVMRNLQAIDNRYIHRKYDLKGSTYNRYESNKRKDKNLNEIVLKDMDFLEFEQCIKATHQKKLEISQTLEIDSNYLAGQGFMDYSLLILKVDWNQYFLDNEVVLQNNENNLLNLNVNNHLNLLQNTIPNLYEKVIEKFGSSQFIFQSEENPCYFYHVGIIDYLQQWTIKKGLERFFKNCINGKDVNTSSQPPGFYSDRFKRFVRKIFANNN